MAAGLVVGEFRPYTGMQRGLRQGMMKPAPSVSVTEAPWSRANRSGMRISPSMPMMQNNPPATRKIQLKISMITAIAQLSLG